MAFKDGVEVVYVKFSPLKWLELALKSVLCCGFKHAWLSQTLREICLSLSSLVGSTARI